MASGGPDVPTPGQLTAAVTYTTDGHKKLRHNRKWMDGWVLLDGAVLTLLSDQHRVLGRASGSAASLPLSEELSIFGGHTLVVVDAFVPRSQARALPSSNGTAVPDHEGGKENSLPIAKRSPARRVSEGSPQHAAPPVSVLPATLSLPRRTRWKCPVQAAIQAPGRTEGDSGSRARLHLDLEEPSDEAHAPARSLPAEAQLPAPSSLPVHPPLKRRAGFNAPKVVGSQQRPRQRPGAASDAFVLAFPPQEQRTVGIPEAFESPAAYEALMASALAEEMSLRLAHVAAQVRSAAAAGEAGGFSELQARLLPLGVRAFFPCRLEVQRPAFQKRRRRGESSEDEGEKRALASSPPRSQLVLRLPEQRGRAAEYRKDDLWVLSPLWDLGLGPGVAACRDSTRAWTLLAAASWHGPGPNGRLGLRSFFGQSAAGRLPAQVAALRCPDLSSEVGLLEFLSGVGGAEAPLLESLARPLGPGSGRRAGASVLEREFRELAAQLKADFGLNGDQERVAEHVLSWAGVRGAAEERREVGEAAGEGPASFHHPSLCLVHGPFGTGKSSLLVALILLLVRLAAHPGHGLSGARVLVCAATNVAVDRVLLGLLDAGFSDFVRVGALRRMHPRLLARSLHCSEGRGGGALRELEGMLHERGGVEGGRRLVEAELGEVRRRGEAARLEVAKAAPVLGATCCSALRPALDGQTLQVLVLDESSQMVEPLSLAAVARSKARFLIAAGDPLQLPPVVAHPAALSEPSGPAGLDSSSPNLGKSLARPLFERLADAGVPAHLLRTQYRCHPALAETANALFYGGRLRDGCDAAQRGALVPGWAPALKVDVRGGEGGCGEGRRSLANRAEAVAVVAVLARLVERGVDPEACGVICLFRAQAALVRSLLLERVVGGGNERVGEVEESPLGGRLLSDSDPSPSPTPLSTALAGVQVATVDAFQGAERDVVLLSTCVSRPSSFVADARRLCVALTRARRHLILVANCPAVAAAAPALARVVAQAQPLDVQGAWARG